MLINSSKRIVLLKVVFFCSYLLLSVLSLQQQIKDCTPIANISEKIQSNLASQITEDKVLVFKYQSHNSLDHLFELMKGKGVESLCMTNEINNYNEKSAVVILIKEGKIIERKYVSVLSEEKLLNYLNEAGVLDSEWEKNYQSQQNTNTIIQTSISSNFLQLNNYHKLIHDNTFNANDITDLSKDNKVNSFSLLENSHHLQGFASQSLIQLDSMKSVNTKTNKGLRFLLSFLILIISSILSFLIVKSSVDWATHSKTELNKYSEEKAKILAHRINEKFTYIRRTE